MIGTQRFTAFGRTASSAGSGSTFGFAGQAASAGDLVHMRARDYDPDLGVFLSADRVQPNAWGSQGFSLYGYAVQNPSTNVDPSGRSVLGGYAKLLDRAAGFSENAAYIGAGLAILIGLVTFEPCANNRSAMAYLVAGAVIGSLVHAVFYALGAPNAALRPLRVIAQAGLPSANGANLLGTVVATGVGSCVTS